MEIDYEIVFSYKRKYVQACNRKSVALWTDGLDMTIAVDCDVKPQTKENIRMSLYLNWIVKQIKFSELLSPAE